MKIIFMGTPDFAAVVLGRLISSEHRILAVYTPPDRPAGRHLKPVAPPAKAMALKYGLTVVQPPSLKAKGEAESLKEFGADVIVVAAYGLLLPPDILSIPPLGCVNVHPSLLPKYRGAAPVTGAILAGDKTTGVTIMLMDQGMDTGPILSQSEEPIAPDDTTGSMTLRLAEKGAGLLLETLLLWALGKIRPLSQSDENASYTKQITKEEGRIDWSRDAEYISRQIRAFQPWPGCFTTWKSRLLKIVQGVSLPERSPVQPGQVLSIQPPQGKIEVAVGTGQGLLGLLQVQPEGKKAMPAGEFVRGQRDFIGSTVN